MDAVLIFGVARFTPWHLVRLAPAAVLLFVSYLIAGAEGDSIPWSAFFAAVMAIISGFATLTFDPSSRKIILQLGRRFAGTAD